MRWVIRWVAMCCLSTWGTGEASGLQGAAAVSVPFRLDQCADHIGIGFSRVYQKHFMREMLAYIRVKQRQFLQDGREDGLKTLDALGSLEKMRTFWDFDGRVTAPLHGFLSAEDYYRRASESLLPGCYTHADVDYPGCRRPVRIRPQLARGQRAVGVHRV